MVNFKYYKMTENKRNFPTFHATHIPSYRLCLVSGHKFIFLISTNRLDKYLLTSCILQHQGRRKHLKLGGHGTLRALLPLEGHFQVGFASEYCHIQQKMV